MDKISTYIPLVLVLIFGGLFAASRLRVKPEPPSHFVYVADTSSSVPKDCKAWTKTVEAGLTGLNITNESHFALITTGGFSTSLAARLVMDRPIPPENTVFGGTADGGQTREELLAEIKSVCEGLETAEKSAIFRSVTIGLEFLRGLGCASPVQCRLKLSSDLDETVDTEVRLRIYRGLPKPDETPLLDNSFAATELCGYEQVGPGDKPRVNVQELLHGFSGLFAEPPVRKPYCEGAEHFKPASK